MKRLLSKLISLVLVMAMIIQILPQKVFADVGTALSPEQTEGSVFESSYSQSPTYVEGEVLDLRSEDGKHFKLSDGSFLSVSYFEPVHYEDSEGKWQDIDNTLVLDGDKGIYSTKQNGKSRVEFAADLSEGLMTRLSWEDHSVSMSLLTTSEIEDILSGEEEIPDIFKSLVPFQSEYNKETAIEIHVKEDEPEDPSSGGYTSKDLTPKTLSAGVMYPEVYKGVDFEYTLKGYDLKEAIILKEKRENYAFSFLLTLENLEAKIQEDGSVCLCNTDGEGIYQIPALYMLDAKGSVSFDLQYTLLETTDGVILAIVPDKDWIEDSERVFPVVIDPTLFVITDVLGMDQSSDIYATYITEGQPNEVHANYPAMFIGHGRGTESPMLESWGVFHFHDLPSIPTNCDVIGATFNLYIPPTAGYWLGYSAYNCPQMPLEMREVNWGENANYYSLINGLTWNNMASLKDEVIDYDIASSSVEDDYMSWNMTGLAKKWYSEGINNRTVAIIPTDRGSYYGNDHFAQIQFFFFFYAPYGYYYNPPYLAVAYRNTAGIEGYYTYNTLDAGNAGTAYIQDNSGQLKVTNELVSYYSTVNPVSIGLVYNSDYFKDQSQDYLPYGPFMDFGSGWTLDIVQKLESVTIDSTNYLKYTDGDGTQHFFAMKNGDNTYFYDEDGLGLKIKSISGGYEMSDDKDNKRIFTGGYLTSLTDSNGNTVSINYTNGKLTSVTQTNHNAASITIATFTYDGNKLDYITDAAGIVTSFVYSNGKLTGITKGTGSVADTQVAEYTYEPSGQKLIKLTDTESTYSLNFTYDSGRVNSYHESVIDDTQAELVEVVGGGASIEYPQNCQTVYRDYGVDRIKDDTTPSDDIYTSYLFDNTGRTVNAYSTDFEGTLIGATNAVYTKNDSTDRKNNRTRRVSSMGETGENLLENGNLISSGFWIMGQYASIDTNVSRGGGGSIRINGKWDQTGSNAYQDIEFDNDTPATGSYILSGWSLGSSVPDTKDTASSAAEDHFKQFGLRAVIYYSEGTTESHYVPFCPDLDLWQFASMAVVPKEPTKHLDKIRVYVVYEQNANTAYFDDISFIEEACKTMKYDEDGNLVSVLTTGLEEVTSTYDNGDLIEMVTGGYGSYTLKYNDDTHNLESVSDDHIEQEMEYTQQGNVRSTALSNVVEESDDPEAPVVPIITIETSATYDNNGNRVATETDDAGNTVIYGYSQGVSEMLGLPSSITDGELNVTTYQYDIFGRTSSVSSGGLASASFVYDKGALSSITRVAYKEGNTDYPKSQIYNFNYDVFGNLKSLGVGNKTLAEYEYGERNGELELEIYGNEYQVDYGYDDRGRMDSWEDSDGNTREYHYDENNRIKRIEDSDGLSYQYTYLYTYDSLDRLTGYEEYEGNDSILSVARGYTQSGQPSLLAWTIGGSSFEQNYTYTDNESTYPEGLLATISFEIDENEGPLPISFNYDSLGRIWRINGKTTREYSYKDNGSNTTTLVSGYINKLGNNEFYKGTFTYDGNGNIESESIDQGPTWRYLYDSLNQLTSASDGTKSYGYSYDGAGNILTASESESNQTVTHTYSYGNSDWKDLLTAFDEEPIVYADHDGNPTSYFNGKRWGFEWSRDRALTRSVNRIDSDETDTSYNYDFDGVRTEKTVTFRTYHNYVDPSVIAPTCTQQGYTIKTCSCGATINTDYVPALGHDYVESYVSPTCTQQGYTLHTCSRCGDTYMTDYIPSLGHNYVVSYVSPTCTEQGYTLHTCSVCGYSYESDYIAANGHDYYTDGFVLAPTCTQQGYTLYICSVCGNELEGDIVPALGHNWVYNSMRHYWRCSRCLAITYGLDDQSVPDDPDLMGCSEECTAGETMQNDAAEPDEDTNDVGICEDHNDSSNEPELQTLDEEVQLRDLTSDVESEVIVSYSYVYSGGKLLQEKVTSELVTETHNFFYDSNGAPYALYINDKIYYYITNLQGDVVGLIDEDGHIRAEYKYDPYGKVKSIQAFDASGNPIPISGSVAEKNPLRYRGYYYDSETGFYYVSSRYYDPAICRFINADDVANLCDNNDIASFDLFAYCGNNPIIREDGDGECWHVVAGAVIGGLFELGSQLYINGGNLSSIDWRKVGIATCTGGLNALCKPIGGAIISGMGNAIISLIDGKNMNEVVTSFAIGFGSSLIGYGTGVLTKKIGGNIAIDQLSKKSSGQIKRIINAAIDVAGKDRNAVKNIAWVLSQDAYKHLPDVLVGKTIPQIANSLLSGFVGYGTMGLMYGIY